MSDFDGLVRDDEVPKVSEKKDTVESPKSSKSSSSITSALGAEDVASLTRKFDLDPELGEQVLVPLVNFLDKYGVGDAVGESPTVSGILTLAEFWNDISPVVKNAADYFGGRQKDLSEDDKEFLDRIREAQKETVDMSLFQEGGESIGESVESEPEPVEPLEVPVDPFNTDEPVNWYDMLGEGRGNKETPYNTNAAATLTLPDTQFGVTGIEQLAKEAGLSVEEVRQSDKQTKINQQSHQGMDYTDPNFGENLDLGADKISASIKQQAEHYERTSQANFVEMPVPENAESYNPLEVDGLDIPVLTGGGLESVEDMAAKVGLTEDDLTSQTAIGGKSPTAPQPDEPLMEDFTEVVLPTKPGESPPETYIVDFDEYSTDDE